MIMAKTDGRIIRVELSKNGVLSQLVNDKTA
jgi:hypothetical protein